MASTPDPARRAVVTGANRGIGEVIARELVARGVHVLATSRTPRADYATLDVTDAASIAELAKRVASDGGLDILVNNAGISVGGFDANVAEQTLDVNFSGVVRVTDALLPLLRDGGRVVMVSSGMGTLSHLRPDLADRFRDPRLGREQLLSLVQSFLHSVAAGDHASHGWPSNAYSVSKVGLNAFVRVLVRELADDPRRILVNAACPGWVRTRMGGSAAPRSVEQGAATPVWLALLPEGGPQGGFFRDQQPIEW